MLCFMFLLHSSLLNLFYYVNCVIFRQLFVNKIVVNVNK